MKIKRTSNLTGRNTPNWTNSPLHQHHSQPALKTLEDVQLGEDQVPGPAILPPTVLRPSTSIYRHQPFHLSAVLHHCKVTVGGIEWNLGPPSPSCQIACGVRYHSTVHSGSGLLRSPPNASSSDRLQRQVLQVPPAIVLLPSSSHK